MSPVKYWISNVTCREFFFLIFFFNGLKSEVIVHFDNVHHHCLNFLFINHYCFRFYRILVRAIVVCYSIYHYCVRYSRTVICVFALFQRKGSCCGCLQCRSLLVGVCQRSSEVYYYPWLYYYEIWQSVQWSIVCRYLCWWTISPRGYHPPSS